MLFKKLCLASVFFKAKAQGLTHVRNSLQVPPESIILFHCKFAYFTIFKANPVIMYQYEKVSSQEAIKLLGQAIVEASQINKHIAIAVCGPEGELIAFLRMDGASPAASLIAQNKAYTAARDRKSTRHMGEFMHENNRPPAFWGDSGITGFGGGLPIIINEKVIGGIGVSGLSEEEDEKIAEAAIAAIYR
jgi:glc operon protein GlcG